MAQRWLGGEHAVPERCLMQPLFDQAEGVAAIHRIRCCGRGSSTRERAKCDPRAQAMWVPVHHESRDDGLIPGETPRK